MQDVDSGFLDRLAGFRRIENVITLTVPGADPVVMQLESGSVRVDASAKVRRTANLRLTTTPAEYEALVTPGALLEIQHGFVDGPDSYLLPVFTGEATRAAERIGQNVSQCSFGDLTTWLLRARFTSAFVPSASAGRLATIEALVTAARTGTLVRNTGSDTGTVGSVVWAEDRVKAMSDLGTDAGAETFFGPDGIYDIRDRMTLSSPPVWNIRGGDAGTLKSIERQRPLDRLYNTVVVRPSKADGTQTWTQQIATVTDSRHPRHPDKIGTVPYFWASPTINSADAALTAAYRILDRVLGNTESLSLEAMSNPALEGGDVIRITTPALPDREATAFQHYIDSYVLNLVSGSMDMETRSQEVDVA